MQASGQDRIAGLWPGVAGLDMQRSEEARRKTIQDFLDANICCLDIGLCQVLRLHAPNISDYFDTVLEEFLRVLFERVVVASTQVELQFAKLSLWTNGCGGSRMGLPYLAARAKTTAFKNAVEQWRRALPGFQNATDNRSRPEWTKTMNKGTKTNYLHLYMRDLLAQTEGSPHANLGEHWKQASASFHQLSPETQEKYKNDARLNRSVASSSQPPLARAASPADDVVEGPLGIASRKGFPVRASAVAAHQRKTKFKDVCEKWAKAHKSKIEASADFPDSVQGVRVCVGGTCTKSMFDDEGERNMKEDAEHLLEYIRLVLLHFPPKDACADPTLVLQFLSIVETVYVLVVHPQHLNQSRFTAEFIMLRPVDVASVSDAVHVLPMQLAFAPGRVVLGVTWPHISDELQFVSRLLETGREWTISNMTKSIVAVGQWLATDQTVVSVEDAKAREAVVKEQQASVAAMKKAMGLVGHKVSGRVPRPGGHKRKPKTEDALRASKQKKKQMPSSDSAGSADTDEETSCDEHWTNILKSLYKNGLATRTPATEKPPADDEIRGPLADDDTRQPLAHKETRGPLADAETRGALADGGTRAPLAHDETWEPGARRGERTLEENGLATLAEVYLHGVLTGFRITCRCHSDAEDKPGVICIKHLPLGNPPMSHAEAKLRLKRWYVGGSQQTWDPQTARSSHLKFGGRSLHMLASGAEGWSSISEEELNDMARQVGPSVSSRGHG